MKPATQTPAKAPPATTPDHEEPIPKGTPNSDRHAMETVFTDEDEVPPGHP